MRNGAIARWLRPLRHGIGLALIGAGCPVVLAPAVLAQDTTLSENSIHPASTPLLETLLQPLQPPVTPALPPLGNAAAYLPVPVLPVHLVIRLSDRRVYVYRGEQVSQSFPVAIGRSGWETPLGRWQVMQMVRNPTWQQPWTGEVVPPGADNPLGSRWIGFWTDGTHSIGFHGTPNTGSVGTAASHGCIRMYDQDVVQLFEIVTLGTTVDVVP